MNIRILTGVVFVVIVILGLGLFFVNVNNTKSLADRISPTGSETQSETSSSVSPNFVRSTSSDGRVLFQYPKQWSLHDTTGNDGRGQFGKIMQSWVLTSFSDTVGNDGIPDNSAKIDIEIQEGGSDLPLEKLVDCGMKTTSCERIGIHNELFIREEQTLNTGMKRITVATFYDDKVLRLTSLIAPGDQQIELERIVNSIYQSISFSDPS